MSNEKNKRTDPRTGKIKYFRFWLSDYLSVAAAMSPAAKGAYMTILLRIIEGQKPLPDDEKMLRRITGIAKKDWPEIREELADALYFYNGEVSADQSTKAIDEFQARSKRGRVNANKRFQPVDGGLEDTPE